jgi:hypothetical protein
MGKAKTQAKFPTVQNGQTIYPLLTEEVTYPAPTTPGPTGVPGGQPGSLAQLVGAAMRDVIGVRPKDPKAFVAAITQSFTGTEVEGRTEYAWGARTGMVAPADTGAFGVVQASVYTQAKATITQAATVLDGLYPIRVDVDPKDVEAIRSVVKTRLMEILTELGQESGPRVQYVDQLFRILAGPTPGASTTVAAAHGLLARLQLIFGLEPARIRTIDEERNVTNFNVLVDSINALRLTWSDQRKYFFLVGDARAPLSTRLPRLWRHLDFIAERLQEVYTIMDSVFLGPAERMVIELDFSSISQEQMFLSDLFSWLQDTATGGGRDLIEDGGREGVRTFASTIAQLRILFEAATDLTLQKTVPDAYKTARVQEALGYLVRELKITENIAASIAARSRPTVSLQTTVPAIAAGRSGYQVVGSGFYEGMPATSIGLKGQVYVVNENLAFVVQ